MSPVCSKPAVGFDGFFGCTQLVPVLSNVNNTDLANSGPTVIFDVLLSSVLVEFTA